jgi:uncharacterized protein YjbI with pentapeptide repeats
VTLTDLTSKAKVMRHTALKPGVNASGENLSGLDLSGVDLTGANLNRANLASTDLTDAILEGVSLVCPVIERTTMRGAVATRAYAHAMAAVSSDWSGIRFNQSPDTTGALFHGVKLTGADLSESNFAGTTFYQCDLTGANLADSVLDHAVFNECLLNGARLNHARMESCMFSRSAARDLDLSFAVGKNVVIDRLTGICDLIGAGTRLRGLTVRHTNLHGSNFAAADLELASLEGVDLSYVGFASANLARARLVACHGLSPALNAADLTEAMLVDCSFRDAVFDCARLENTVITSCTIVYSSFDGIFGRGLSVRDSSLVKGMFRNAYLYRAFLTGDPVTGMVLDNADFSGANLIQATLAASMRNARLVGARAAYARLNQADLTNAELAGFKAYKASAVKTIWPSAAPSEVLVAPESRELGST